MTLNSNRPDHLWNIILAGQRSTVDSDFHRPVSKASTKDGPPKPNYIKSSNIQKFSLSEEVNSLGEPLMPLLQVPLSRSVATVAEFRSVQFRVVCRKDEPSI